MSLIKVPSKDQWEPQFHADSFADFLDLKSHRFVPYNRPEQIQPAHGLILVSASGGTNEEMLQRVKLVLPLNGWSYYRIAQPLLDWWSAHVGTGSDVGLGHLQVNQQWGPTVLSDTLKVFGQSRNYPSSRCLVQFDFPAVVSEVTA